MSTAREVELPPVRFWIEESGSGTPILLIHGLSGSADWWRYNIEVLARQHRVIAIELLGFGRNRRFRNSHLPLSLDELSGLIARFIEDEIGEPVHLVGHSMGGHTSILLAAKRPALLRSLTLVNSTGIPFRIDPRAHLRELRRPHPAQLRFSRILALDALRAGPTSIALASAYLFTNDARAMMKSIVTPTLLIWGDHDPLVPLRYGEEMQSLIAGSRLVVLENAAHVAMWDNANDFNRELIGFTRAIDRNQQPERLESLVRFSWNVRGTSAGLAWRATASRPRVILLHGLGVGTEYFRPLARSLSNLGFECAAPELPDALDVPIAEIIAAQGRQVVGWLRESTESDEPVIWAGHSTGTEIVRWIEANEPSLVARVVHLSPVWHERRHPWASLFAGLLRDAFRERLVLIARAAYAYWNHGLMVVIRQGLAYLRSARGLPVLAASSRVIVGGDDPLADWELLRRLGDPLTIIADGPHAVHDSAPDEVAAAIVTQWRIPE